MESQAEKRRQELQKKLEDSGKYSPCNCIAQARTAQNEAREQQLKQDQCPEEEWTQIDADFTIKFNQLQADLVSWPELQKEQADKTQFFANLQAQYIELRDHTAAISYALPAKIIASFQHQLQQWQQLYEQEKDKAVPKKKFAFARKAP